jgi:methionyl-tRNA synthetase
MLMGYGGLNLPYDVPANEYLTIEGRKLSSSRNWAVWLPDYLSRYDPDPLRYLLSVNMPETGDTDFSWREFIRRNNDELVATYGNLVQRVLIFVYSRFDGVIPTHSKYNIIRPYLDDLNKDMSKDYLDLDEQSINEVEDVKEFLFREAGDLISKCKFKQAMLCIMNKTHETNQYLERKSPWKVIKQDKQAAADSLYIALYVVSCLKTVLYPFLPFSSQKLHKMLGFKGSVEDYGWQPLTPEPGQELLPPEPLFLKLEESLVDEETARLGK